MEITTPASTTNAAWLLPHLFAHVAAGGFATSLMRDVPGLRGRNLGDPDLRVTDAAAAEAWRLATVISGDDALGLHMAQTVPRGALDLLEYAIRSSATLGSALEQLSRYGRVVNDRAAAKLIWEGDTLAVTWDGTGQRQRFDFAPAFLMRLAREAVDKGLVPVEVRLAYPAPTDLSEYRAFYRCPLVHGAPLYQVLFARQDLARPFVSADAALAGMTGRRLEKLLGQLPKRVDAAAVRVRRQLIEMLSRGDVTAERVGRELAMSERTLHRRLHDEGTTFRRVLDEVRRDVATNLLRQNTVAIAEIAFILGYSDPAAFSRSFRRWTGHTPLAVRRASRGK